MTQRRDAPRFRTQLGLDALEGRRYNLIEL